MSNDSGSEPLRQQLKDERLRALIDSALDAMIAMDSTGKIIDWNFRAEEIFGWTREEALDTSLAELIVPEAYRAAHIEGLKRYLETGEGPVLGHRLELTAMRKSGEEFAVELSVIAIPLKDDVVFSAFVRDISARDADMEYRARMAALVDSSYDAIIGKDNSGTIMSWNHGAEHIYGYTEEEAVGQTVEMLLPPDVPAEEPEIVHAMQTGQRLDQFQTIRRHKNQTLIPVSITVSPIADAAGTIIGSSSIERDISESQLQKRELRKAKEDADKANRARVEFLANVSHELRTPMNAIIGMTQLALSENLSDEIRDYIQTANDAAHSLLILLDDILDFSKLDNSKFTIEHETFNLREIIDETVKTLSARAFEKGLELVCDIDAATPQWLIGDSGRIRQTIMNLANNAIKFTEQGEVTVVVSVLHASVRNCRIQFAVRDTGVGISPEDQRRVLEPFTQIDASTTRQYGGAGLGLAICKELLGLMGSSLVIESEVGKGSSFSFILAMERPRAGQLPTFADEKPLLQGLNDMTALVVDDNETNGRVVRDMLSNWSMQADHVSSGRQAMEMLKEAEAEGHEYSLAIVDALMPGMDGYALSQHIAEKLDSPPDLILMLSSSDRTEFKQREQDARVAAYLPKPVSQSDLMDAIMHAKSGAVVLAASDRTDVVRSTKSLSVLLAEDTPANQKVAMTVLKKRGHRVTLAQNGREAVELNRKGEFDVILMDVQMPILDGLQATRAIRERESDSGTAIPIIAMTAHAMRGDREKCLEAGMDAYIAKPIDVAELVDLVESVARDDDARDDDARDDDARDDDGKNHSEPLSARAEPATSHQEPMMESDIINFESTMQRLGGDEELFREFIDVLFEDTPQLLSALDQAIDAGETEPTARHAHSLKGLVSNFSAEACMKAAHQVELAGKEGDFDLARTLFDPLEQQVQLVRDALQPYRE